jgi:hypothetical protein
MNAIKAVVRNGRIETWEPINLPEGTELLISLPNGIPVPEEDFEEGWDTSPEGIAAWLQWYDKLEPLKMTAAEEAEAEAWLRKCDGVGWASLDSVAEDLRG